MVGGLPLRRVWPYEYRAVFSAADVIEEYTRPARYAEYGREVVMPALTGIELVELPRVGTLEAFNTDGLRYLADHHQGTLREKTMRYPGTPRRCACCGRPAFFAMTGERGRRRRFALMT